MTKPFTVVSLLGEFDMRVNENRWMQNGVRSRKTQLFLANLLCSNGKSVSQERLMDLLWPDMDDSVDPSNALKNIVYRVRRYLNQLAGTETDFILFSQNAYSWNWDLPCRIDVKELECAANQSSGTVQERIEVYRSVLKLYHGGFMENIMGEDWVYSRRAYYESLFVQCMVQLCTLLEEEKRTDEVIATCEQALALSPFHEDLHRTLLKAYIKSNQHQKALKHYTSVSEMFSRELGLGLPEPIYSMYEEIIRDIHWTETNVTRIKEKILACQQEGRAFLCEYAVFEQLCQVQLRSGKRNGQSMILILLTVTNRKGELPSPENLKHVMHAFQDTILNTLRKSDIVCRYSPSQLVLGLSVANTADGKIIMARIRSAFSQRFYHQDICIKEQITTLE